MNDFLTLLYDWISACHLSFYKPRDFCPKTFLGIYVTPGKWKIMVVLPSNFQQIFMGVFAHNWEQLCSIDDPHNLPR